VHLVVYNSVAGITGLSSFG